MTTHCIPDRTNFLRGYAAAKAEMTQKKNPQDATRRNVQAVNKRVAALTLRVRNLEAALRLLLRKVK